jgi:hypothetical protein
MTQETKATFSAENDQSCDGVRVLTSDECFVVSGGSNVKLGGGNEMPTTLRS